MPWKIRKRFELKKHISHPCKAILKAREKKEHGKIEGEICQSVIQIKLIKNLKTKENILCVLKSITLPERQWWHR